jgi:rhodanese-related sulfurtransferase
VDRLPQRDEPMRIPERLPDGLVRVDATWGTIAPMRVHPEVETIGELETIAHLEAGGRAVDTRQPHFVEHGTLPGDVVAIPHQEVAARRAELPADQPVVLFCNGPQCGATPQAIEALVDAGHPPSLLRWYRGGIHDWVTLGLPLA